MDIHKPKPVHSWRELLGEIGVIVIGVLIALGAENIVEQLHWRAQAKDSRAALKEALGDSALYAWERLSVAPCLTQRLRSLAGKLEGDTARWAASPMPSAGTGYSYVDTVPAAYAAPSRVYVLDAWRNVVASNDFGHLSTKEVAKYGLLFSAIAYLNDRQQREDEEATKLAPLSFSRQLDGGDRLRLLTSVAEVDRNLNLIDTDADGLISAIGDAHLGFDADLIEQRRRALLADQKAYRGACVIDMPLHLN